jgi:hypothetical protein
VPLPAAGRPRRLGRGRVPDRQDVTIREPEGPTRTDQRSQRSRAAPAGERRASSRDGRWRALARLYG